jgi:chemotaxis protein MotB
MNSRRSVRGIQIVGLFFVLSGLAAGCGGRNWEADYNALQEELERAQAERDAAAARLTELEARNNELSSLLEQRGESLNEVQRMLAEARAREQANQARLASLRAVARSFRDMVAAGQLRVRIVRGNMVVELPENVLFDSGDARLRSAGQQALGQVAQILSRVENRNFLIAGHTDNVPTGRHNRRFPSNWELSAARGVSVARHLIEQGLPADRVAAAGYAETQPVASNDTPEGQAQNRRIEIIVLPNMEELPDLSDLEGELQTSGGGGT